MATTTVQSLEKAWTLLNAIAATAGSRPLPDLARDLGLPLASAHRLCLSLEANGLIVREKRGHYHLGPRLIDLAATADTHQIIARVSQPHLKKLARETRATVHLGVLENDMVTYLVKESFGRSRIFTRQGMQLEAYCTGIGKLLLAHLPHDQLESYLREGPFIRLTSTTITEPEALAQELAGIRQRGYAIDNAEMAEDIRCLAVPLRDDRNRVRAAISASMPEGPLGGETSPALMDALAEAAASIESRLFGIRHPQVLA